MFGARANDCLVRLVAERILPHEPKVRAWLIRAGVSAADCDDFIQEAYCRIYEMDGFERIERPAAFFFQVTRNLFRSRVRHEHVIRIESARDIDLSAFIDESPLPERIVGDRRDYDRVRRLIDQLPDRCRKIFTMRKVDELSQREIAARLGVTVNVVENEGARGVRLVLEALRSEGSELAERYDRRHALRIRPR